MVYYLMCFQYPEVFPQVSSISGLLSKQTCKDTVSLTRPYVRTDLPITELDLN